MKTKLFLFILFLFCLNKPGYSQTQELENSIGTHENIAFYKSNELYTSQRGKIKNWGPDKKVKQSKTISVNDFYTLSSFSHPELAELKITSGHIFFQGIKSPHNADWVYLERNINNMDYNLCLFNSKTKVKQILFTQNNSPDIKYAFKPIAWSKSKNIIFLEALEFGSLSEHEGIWEYNIVTGKYKKLDITSNYMTIPILSPDRNRFLYTATLGNECDGAPDKIYEYNLLNDEEKLILDNKGQSTTIVGWTKRIKKTDIIDINEIETPLKSAKINSVVALPTSIKLPFPSGQSYTISRTNHGTQSIPDYAIDFTIPVGTEILAAADGKIKFAGFGYQYSGAGGYGNCVIIQHVGGTFAYYGHLYSIGVKVGDEVKQGYIIGKSGNSGCSTGPHLHFDFKESEGGARMEFPVVCNNNKVLRDSDDSVKSTNVERNGTSNFDLNCSGAIQMENGVPRNGDTKLARSTIYSYKCKSSWTESGPEVVHSYYHSGGNLVANLTNVPTGVDLDVFILKSCDPDDCVGTVESTSTSFLNAPAGNYLIIVEGSQSTNSLYPCSTGSHGGNFGTYILTVTSSGGCTKPTTPTLNAPTSITSNSVTISWNNVGAANYDVYYATGSCPSGSETPYTTTTNTSITVSGLSAGTTYKFIVIAKNSSTCFSGNSNCQSATTSTIITLPSNDNCNNLSSEFELTSNGSCKTGDVNNATASGKTKGSCDNYTGTPSLADVWYYFQAKSTSHTITVHNLGNLDAVVMAYSSCSSSTTISGGCAEITGTGDATLSISGLTINNYYYIRVYDYGNVNATNGIFEICVTHTTSTPTLTVSTTSLPDFGNVMVDATSSAQSFTVSGSNLTGDVLLSAPAGFEISKSSGSGYANSQSLTQSGGSVSNTTIYVRFSPTSTGAKSGDISISSSGADTKKVAVIGTGTQSCTPPGNVSAPSNQTVSVPSSASFSVTASGSNNLYKWEMSEGFTWHDIPNSSPYSNINTATLNISSTTLSMNGYQYRCVVSSSCSQVSVTSSPATLTVNSGCTAPYNGIISPSSPVVTAPNSMTFSVTSEGSTPFIYQWYWWDGTNWIALTNTSPYSGTTTKTLNINPTSTSIDGYFYTCVVSNSCGDQYDIEYIQLKVNDNNSIVDIDGNIYTTVSIGKQVWLGQNLKTTKYNDGTTIPLITSNNTWASLTTPAYCWYNNDIWYKNPYGALYNWYSVNTGKLCPQGWHVPTDEEWTILIKYLGGENVAGGKLKETETLHWNTPNDGASNSTNFNGLGGGFRSSFDGTFSNFRSSGDWWSSTQDNSNFAWERSIWNSSGKIYRYSNVDKKVGISIRCLCDTPVSSEINSINKSIKVYPNPTTGIITIEGLPENEKAEITIYNMNSKLVKEQTTYSSLTQMDISDVVSGVYLLVINNRFEQAVKIIKK